MTDGIRGVRYPTEIIHSLASYLCDDRSLITKIPSYS